MSDTELATPSPPADAKANPAAATPARPAAGSGDSASSEESRATVRKLVAESQLDDSDRAKAQAPQQAPRATSGFD